MRILKLVIVGAVVSLAIGKGTTASADYNSGCFTEGWGYVYLYDPMFFFVDQENAASEYNDSDFPFEVQCAAHAEARAVAAARTACSNNNLYGGVGFAQVVWRWSHGPYYINHNDSYYKDCDELQ